MKKSYRGYISSRPFFKERVPQSVQNLVIRNYCNNKKVNFLLSKAEYAIDDSYSILDFVIDNLKKVDGIVFYSILMLPKKKDYRNKIYKKIISNKKSLNFALENISIQNDKDIPRVENIVNSRITLDYCPKPKDFINFV